MHPNKDKEDVPLGPPPITAGGTYDIDAIKVGCKVYATRPNQDGTHEDRQAEVLSRRETPQGLEFFVHWDHFNKRLDDWIPSSRILTSRDLEWPRPKLPPQKPTVPHKQPANPIKSSRPQSLLKRATTGNISAAPSNAPSPSHSTSSLKRKTPHDEDEDEDAEGEMDITMEFEEGILPHDFESQAPIMSKEQEIEKLRTSGSMTQSISEVARVKNLNRLQIGRHEVEAWYFSPYPKEYAHLPVLYICEFCLSFYPSPFMLSRHRKRCNLFHPPGNEIYREEDISFFELDGKKQLTWCRNLSLLSKCFLDHKTLYYDVQPFMYYVMTRKDDTGCHLIGYFSKEKESAENYNVACILTLPQHQRHGYGKLLIEFSYELSKKEGKLGSPEKPLSDLGLLSYRAFWAETIVELLLQTDDELSIDDIAQRTAITHSDVMYTCTTLQLFKHYKAVHVICLTDPILEQHTKAMAKRKRRINPDCLQWKPPVFTREQLRFGY